ncbi:hypothetical protein LguiA_030510 [Lonicera macranthoides]
MVHVHASLRRTGDERTKALVEYASLRTKAAESNDEPAAATNTDPRLAAVIKRMVENPTNSFQSQENGLQVFLLDIKDWLSKPKESNERSRGSDVCCDHERLTKNGILLADFSSIDSAVLMES